MLSRSGRREVVADDDRQERIRQLDEFFARRIIAADRDLIDGIVAAMQRQLACFQVATSTDVPAEVIVALQGLNEARAATDLAMLTLLGMQGGLGKSPEGMMGKLVDPETGVTLTFKMEKSIDLGDKLPTKPTT
jgi:hypothetical protein